MLVLKFLLILELVEDLLQDLDFGLVVAVVAVVDLVQVLVVVILDLQN
jgi:hypothetical protein